MEVYSRWRGGFGLLSSLFLAGKRLGCGGLGERESRVSAKYYTIVIVSRYYFGS
jgi:hypothetical protein